MTTWQHFQHSRRAAGFAVGLLATLPDVFIIARTLAPTREARRFCLNMHNTEESVNRMAALHPKIGRAWQLHREQDLATHDFTYPYVLR